MMFSTRQILALDCLLRGYGEFTLAQIAERLGVSGRTIHRELAGIAPALLQDYGLVLSGKSGQGLRIVGTPERIRRCLDDLESARVREISPEERRRMIAALLLEAGDVVKLQSLESDLGEAAGSVRRDLEETRPWFEAQGLAVSLRRGIGVSLEGPEWGRRQALSSLVMEEFGEAGLLALVGEAPGSPREDKPVAAILLRMVPVEGFRAAEGVLASLPKDCTPALAPRDYLGFVAHLAVGAERRRRGFPLGDPRGTPLAEVRGDSESRAAALIAEAIALAWSLPPDRAELSSVESYLRGAKLERRSAALTGELDPAALAGLKALIARCEEGYGATFAEDRTLRDGLAGHWAPALYRLRNRLPIRNPILPQIRAEYPKLFDALRGAADLAFPELRVPDDEIGYLVLHFGSSIERRVKTGQRFRALVVCSAGIGSAQMLASRIRAELPEIDIVASLSWFDIDEKPKETWDIIVSTLPLPPAVGEYILVSPLLPAAGIAELKAYMERRRHLIRAAARTAADSPGPSGGSLTDLKQLSGRLAAAVEILEAFRLFPDEGQVSSWVDFLASAVRRCAEAKLVQEPALVLRDLALRSSDGGMILPGSSLLFLHARSAGLARPSLSMHALASAPRPEGTRREAEPTRLILMLAPPGLSSRDQDILNEISSSFLDPLAVEALESGSEASIRTYYSRHLDRFARSMSQQGE